MAAKVGFLLIFAYIEAVRFSKNFPVKSANFITRRVGSVLFKFNTESFVGVSPLSSDQNMGSGEKEEEQE